MEKVIHHTVSRDLENVCIIVMEPDFAQALYTATASREVHQAIMQLKSLNALPPNYLASRVVRQCRTSPSHLSREPLATDYSDVQMSGIKEQVHVLETFSQSSAKEGYKRRELSLAQAQRGQTVVQSTTEHSWLVADLKQHINCLNQSISTHEALIEMMHTSFDDMTNLNCVFRNKTKPAYGHADHIENVANPLVRSRLELFTAELTLLFWQSSEKHALNTCCSVDVADAKGLYTELLKELPNVILNNVRRQYMIPCLAKREQSNRHRQHLMKNRLDMLRSLADKLVSCREIVRELTMHNNEIAQLRIDICKLMPDMQHRILSPRTDFWQQASRKVPQLIAKPRLEPVIVASGTTEVLHAWLSQL